MKQPEIYEKILSVREEHLDKQDHVNNVQYVQWVQDIAEEHWEMRASDRQKSEFIWVVIRHEIDYKKEAFLGDKILLQTHVGNTTHVTSKRHVTIKNAESGALLAQAETTWCLLNANNKRPTKISKELVEVFLK